MELNEIKNIIKNMTLEEKIYQLQQLTPEFFQNDIETKLTGPLQEMEIDKNVINNTGSILAAYDAKTIKNIQKEYLKNNRNKIPLLFMDDVIHGFKTIFPIPLGLACSWDIELVEKCASISAKEAAVSGIHVTFSPMVDLVRDPRWGRVMESTGEDPYLNSQFAKAFVKGYQGDNSFSDIFKIACCVKHFAGYGACEAGRDYNTVDISERFLYEFYLPSYKAAIDQGCEMVMSAFNLIDGIPTSANKKLFRDILRNEWGFKGVTISDWNAVEEILINGVAESKQDAAKKAIEAGIDIEMMSTNYANYLKNLVENKIIDESLIDEAVERILTLKNKLGLFENPYRTADEELEKKYHLCPEHRATAREAAANSMVLLKNDEVLPLKKDAKIALIGPYSDNKNILGRWSDRGDPENSITLKEGILSKITYKDNLIVEEGCKLNQKQYDTNDEQLLNNAFIACKEADVIILALGEDEDMTGEAASRADISIPDNQIRLAEKILEAGKPVILVLFNGRPLVLKWFNEKMSAILEAWFPGTEGGNAIADILFGDVNPSGKLTMSFPYNVGQIPVYYNSFNTGRPKIPGEDNKYTTCFLDIPNEPLYPFGYGLSYTRYKYSNLSLNKESFTYGENIIATVEIENIGNYSGFEIVQWYIRDIAGSVARPVKELKGFEKIFLKPGEKKKVEFVITEEKLKFYTIDMSYKAEKGRFKLFVGGNSVDLIEAEFKFI
ncbi:beta-glucosidase BglX [Caldicellulosiruptoraceae bacterium PP1]